MIECANIWKKKILLIFLKIVNFSSTNSLNSWKLEAVVILFTILMVLDIHGYDSKVKINKLNKS